MLFFRDKTPLVWAGILFVQFATALTGCVSIERNGLLDTRGMPLNQAIDIWNERLLRVGENPVELEINNLLPVVEYFGIDFRQTQDSQSIAVAIDDLREVIKAHWPADPLIDLSCTTTTSLDNLIAVVFDLYDFHIEDSHGVKKLKSWTSNLAAVVLELPRENVALFTSNNIPEIIYDGSGSGYSWTPMRSANPELISLDKADLVGYSRSPNPFVYAFLDSKRSSREFFVLLGERKVVIDIENRFQRGGGVGALRELIAEGSQRSVGSRLAILHFDNLSL